MTCLWRCDASDSVSVAAGVCKPTTMNDSFFFFDSFIQCYFWSLCFFCSVLLFVLFCWNFSLSFVIGVRSFVNPPYTSMYYEYFNFFCYYYCFYCARCHPLRFIVLLNSVFLFRKFWWKFPFLSLSTFRTFLAMSSVIFYATVLSYDHKRYNCERESERERAIEINRFVIHLSAIKHVMSSRGLTLWHLSHSLSL